MLTKNIVENHLKGKENIIIDELLTNLNMILSQENRNELCNILRKLNWEPGIPKVFLGKQSVAWTRRNDSRDLELNIRKLELLDFRQERDIQTIDKLLEKGFSHEDCMSYLRMIYGVKIEILSNIEDEEQEAKNFAQNIIEDLNLSNKLRQQQDIIESIAFTYYIDRKFPELSTSPLYIIKFNFIKTSLNLSGLSKDQVEWKLLSYDPGLLDLLTKLPRNKYKDFRKNTLKSFIKSDTIEKFNLLNLESRVLSALCIFSRRLKKGLHREKLLGLSEKVQDKIYKYAQTKYKEFG